MAISHDAGGVRHNWVVFSESENTYELMRNGLFWRPVGRPLLTILHRDRRPILGLRSHRTVLDYHIAVLVGFGLAEREVGDRVARVDDEQVRPRATGKLITVRIAFGFI